jgi:ABC-type antimicrobial peptide transport system permease subunit
MLRGLSHFWRINLAVAAAAAINTAVLAGALIVGDSVRGSLRDMTLDRLGAIDLALVAERFFPEDLAPRLAAADGFAATYSAAAAAVLLPGSAVRADTGARASQVNVHGIDERFTAMFMAPSGGSAPPSSRSESDAAGQRPEREASSARAAGQRPDSAAGREPGDAVTQALPTFDLTRRAGQLFPSAVINETLRRQIGAEIGDAVLLNFRTRDDVPDDTLLGNKANAPAFGTIRTTVVAVIPDTGIGRFSLSPHQAFPANAYVALPELQDAIERQGEVNAVFVASPASAPEAVGTGVAAEAPPAQSLLRQVLELGDLGLRVEWHDGALLIESSEYVLRPETVIAIEAAAEEIGARSVPITTYLATTMAVGERILPYSTVTALGGDPADLAPLALLSGQPAPFPRGAEILLNEWAAGDLGAAPGDALTMEYYVVGPYEQLVVEAHEFTVAGVVAMEGLAADRRLTPDYPGIEDTDNIADWDPPFPVDLALVRPEDERYWDEHGATPKAFVGAETAAELWATRYGSITSIRLMPAAVADANEAARPATATPVTGQAEAAAPGPAEATLTPAQQAFVSSFSGALLRRLNLPQFGMRFLAVKAEGLEAATGATDFSGLFIGFSFFIIVSAALLVGLLFSLGVETRAGEIGLRLAVGYPVKRVRRQMLAEGGAVAAAGALLGLPAGIGYAALMMLGLRTLWLPAVGTSMLSLHVTPGSLAMGWLISMAVVLAAIWFTVRRLGKVPATSLLRGSIFRSSGGTRGARRWRRTLALGSAAFALLMLAWAVASGATMDPMVFGTIGFPLLVAGLAGFADWCRTARGRLGGRGSAVVAMAARNSAWSPGRSILSVALVAFATFVIVTVAANYRDPRIEAQSKSSGTGGFALMATSEIPIHHELDSPDGRFELGFPDEDEALLAANIAEIYALRAVAGDDASCLNLYRPQRPRLVGASDELIARGGFRFASTLPPPSVSDPVTGQAGQAYDPANPWTLLYQDLGPGVVPAIGDANSVQWILHLGLGDDLTIENERGEPLQLRIVGTFAESVLRSELVISEASLLANFPGQSGYSTFLIDAAGAGERTDSGGSTGAAGAGTSAAGSAGTAGRVTNTGQPGRQAGGIDAISEALERTLAPYGFDAEPTDELLARFLVVQNTYLSTFQLLGGLGLLLGTLGLGVVLVRNVIERRAELATLRACGYRRALLSRMVLAENAFLLLIGTAIGSLASLIAVAPRFAGGGFSLPWGTLGLILLAVLAAGMVSSLAAVVGALRVPLLPVLKGE